MRWLPTISVFSLLGLVLTGCGDGETSTATVIDPGLTLVSEAEALMPDYLAFHSRVIARTCGPDNGVCHNGKEFPDLHTPGNMLDAVGKPCNLAEQTIEDIADMCEQQGDLLVITSGVTAGFIGRIRWHEIVDDALVFTLDENFPDCADHMAPFRIEYGDGTGELILEVEDPALAISCGAAQGRVPNFTELNPDIQVAVQRRIRMGDPNRNGVLGFDQGGAEVVPGDPEMSYVLQRVLGTVPGTIMPLANQPLDAHEYLAFYCWIETLEDNPRVDDPIDYANCDKAKQVLEEGELTLPTPLYMLGQR